MFAVVIYGPAGSGKTHNASDFLKYYGKSVLFDTGRMPMSTLDRRNFPKDLTPDALVLTADRPRCIPDGLVLVHVDDAMRAIGKSPFRLGATDGCKA